MFMIFNRNACISGITYNVSLRKCLPGENVAARFNWAIINEETIINIVDQKKCHKIKTFYKNIRAMDLRDKN